VDVSDVIAGHTMRPLLLTLTVLLASAQARAADAKAPDKVTYDDHVLPLLREKCTACHGQDKKSAGLQLHTYAGLMKGSSSGKVVKPGDPDASPLYLSVAHKAEPFMPPKSPPLPAEAAQLLQRWIAGGALENAGSKVVVMARPKVDLALPAAARGKPEGPPPMPTKPLPQDPPVRTVKANAVTALAASPWAPLVAVGGQKQVLLYHSDTLELLGVLPFPEGVPNVLKFSRNGALLLAGGGHAGKSGKVVVWSVTSGERVITVGDESDAVLAADISSDQTQIALGGPAKMIRIYSTRDGKLLHEIKKHTDWVTALEYSPDGVLLATGDRNGGLFVWEAFTAREYFTLRGHTAAITDISWRPDGNVCASSSEDTTVRLWEMENGSQVKGWGAHGGGAQAVRYGRDGRLVSCGRDRVVKVWDGAGNQQRVFEALPDVALRATFTHDGGRVVGGDWTGKLAVWSAADGKAVGALSANPPSLAERLEVAIKELEARQQARDNLAAAAAASQAALDRANAGVAAAQKSAGDTSAAAKAMQEKVGQAKAAAEKAKAAVAAAQSEARAKGVLAQAQSEAAAKVKDVADKSPGDAALAAAAKRAGDLATQVGNEKSTAEKAANDAGAAQKAAEAAVPAAEQAAAAAANAAAAAPKAVDAAQAQVKAAQAKLTADQAAAAAAAAACNQAAARVERLKGAQTVARQGGK
jgi:hypothetical protein